MPKNRDFSGDSPEVDSDLTSFLTFDLLKGKGRKIRWTALKKYKDDDLFFDNAPIASNFQNSMMAFDEVMFDPLPERKSKPVKSDLNKFPKPSVAVDVAVLSVIQTEKKMQLVALATLRNSGHAQGSWALPGRILREHETLEQTAIDAVAIKLGIDDVRVNQLRVFDDPKRDPRGWVLSVAHIATIPARVAKRALRQGHVAAILIDAESCTLPDSQLELPFEQIEILHEAVKELRRQYALLPDPGHILDDEFTLLQLREIHEAVHDDEIAPDTFRREMLPNLQATGHRQEGVVGKPPMMYRRKERWVSKVRTSRFISQKMINADDVL